MSTSVRVTTAPISPPEQPDRWQPRPGRGKPVDITADWPSEADPLLVLLHALPADDPRRAGTRARAIEWYLPMTGHLARRFTRRGEPLDDVTQAAVIGLIKAVDRFDITRGVPFVGYAAPTIVGEIVRHFRDNTWDVRVPRRVQELYLQLAVVTDELTRDLQGSPNSAQLAERLAVSGRELGVARQASQAYRLLSLDNTRPDGDEQLSDSFGACDPGLGTVENRMLLQRRLARLSVRDRRIIVMRFEHELTQSEIAAQLGVSQMHISRLLARCLSRLRQMA
ncbi:SigB/SigF/SigG family RNA polymerase sigma factor [Catellatospora sichuanensis]|uniref:SigB/SigF/SigG family RNA polymerase sigma factor n=1 Tax=Catellatospora sichuanensis TaxID=1969805 RepID=UPI001183AD9C|nr:SigB/SigF/SigG family RNA polymerase sigma factor [Catellatospora sichuanensis]